MISSRLDLEKYLAAKGIKPDKAVKLRRFWQSARNLDRAILAAVKPVRAISTVPAVAVPLETSGADPVMAQAVQNVRNRPQGKIYYPARMPDNLNPDWQA